MFRCLGDGGEKSLLVPVLDVNAVNNWGGLKLGACTEGEPVEVVTVDSLDLPGCDFFKIDVEGMELKVLCLPKDSPIRLQGFDEVAEG